MATTVIDALLVSLGLDASAFEKGAEKANQTQKKIGKQAGDTQAAVDKQDKKLEASQIERAKRLEVRAKQAVQGFATMRNEALKLFAVFTAGSGLKSFLENTLGSAAALDRMSSNIGMSSKDLSMWQLAAKNAGGTAEGMTAHLKDASVELAKLNKSGDGSEKIMALFKWAAISGVKVNIDDLKTGADVVFAQADVLKALSEMDPAMALVAASAMGVSDESLNLLKQGSAAVRKLRQDQAGLAEETAKLSKPAEEIRKEIDALGNSFSASGLKIVGVFLPAIKGVAAALKDIAGFLADEDALGEGVARIFAFFGNKDAQAALESNQKDYSTLFRGSSLNKGEDAELARRRKMAPTIDGQVAPAGRSSSAPAGAAGLPRGMRNNNPGNIEYGAFAKKHGATGSDGRFAIFPTMEAGQAAMQALLGGYLGGGHNTVGKVINRWAPGFENNTAAYVAAVSKQIGVGSDQKLDSSHLPALAEAISRHENGAAWGRRNAEAAANMPTGAAAAAQAGGAGRAGGNTNSSEVRVGQITVNTQATDATGIAQSIGGALKQYGFAAQMNTGMA